MQFLLAFGVLSMAILFAYVPYIICKAYIGQNVIEVASLSSKKTSSTYQLTFYPTNTSALYDEMEGRLLNVDSSVGTNTAKIEENSKRLTRCETGVVEMETHNTTNQLSDISYRIGILERNQTQDRTEFYNIVTKLENIDAQFGKDTANIEENAKTLVRIVTELGAIKTNNESELKDMRQRIGTLEFYQIQESVRAGEFETRLGNLESDVNTYGTIVQNNSNSFSRLETDIWQFELDRAHKSFELRELNTTVHELSNNLSEVMTILETSINGEYDKRISILELDCNLHALIVQNHTMRITQLEKDTSIDASSIQLHEDKIAELTANLTSESSIIKEHSENIAVIKSNLMRLDNSTFVNNVNRFGQLEFDITDLEIKLFAQNVTLQKQSTRIEELESDKIRDQDMIINNTLKLSQLKTYVTELNVSRLMETSINLVQSNRLLELKLIANETETTLEEYGAKLTNLTGKQRVFSCIAKCNSFIRSNSKIIRDGDMRFETLSYFILY